MKAMLLAAGIGKRMRPLTRLQAKPALPVLNRPLVHWTLEQLRRHGVSEVIVNLHHRPGSVRRAIGDGGAFGLRVRYSYEPTILGTGGGPRKVRRLLGEQPVLIVNGDVLFDLDLTSLVARHRRSGARATLALRRNPDPRRYGPVVTREDRIVWLPGASGRRRRGRVSLFTGVQVMEPALLERLGAGASDSVRDLYAALVEAGEDVRGLRVRGAWYDFGTPAAYLASQRAMLAGGFRGLRPRRCLVHTDAEIGPGARVAGSVVGAGAVVASRASVRASVLWEGAHVGAGARLVRCVVARGVRVPQGALLCERVLVPGGSEALA
jgi:NDP-sugar pyrophosphorylase family protein